MAALGANQPGVLQLVLRQVVVLGTIGIALGLAAVSLPPSFTIKAVHDEHDIADLVLKRAAGYTRFEEWHRTHPVALTPAAVIAAIGSLYEVLPVASRWRPLDPGGVARMHHALAHLSR